MEKTVGKINKTLYGDEEFCAPVPADSDDLDRLMDDISRQVDLLEAGSTGGRPSSAPVAPLAKQDRFVTLASLPSPQNPFDDSFTQRLSQNCRQLEDDSQDVALCILAETCETFHELDEHFETDGDKNTEANFEQENLGKLIKIKTNDFTSTSQISICADSSRRPKIQIALPASSSTAEADDSGELPTSPVLSTQKRKNTFNRLTKPILMSFDDSKCTNLENEDCNLLNNVKKAKSKYSMDVHENNTDNVDRPTVLVVSSAETIEIVKREPKETDNINEMNAIKEQHISSNLKSHSKSDDIKSFFKGFVTASNKIIDISKEALEKGERFLNESEYPKIINSENFRNDSTIHNPLNTENSIKSEFMGFVTASNKKIVVSKEAIEKVKGIFKEPECENINTSFVQDISSYPESSTKDDKISSDFMGFVTASNKKITVSKEAIEKVKGIFKEPEFENIDTSVVQDITSNPASSTKDDNISSNFMGFITASNKKITVSKEAIEKVKGIFKESECENIDTSIVHDITSNPESLTKDDNISSDFMGFITASNKKITVSKEALEKVQSIFNESEYEKNINSKTFCNISTNHQRPNNEDSINSEFNGFVTANNKKVVVSKEAIEKVKEIFKEPECKNIDTSIVQDISSYPESSTKDDNISSDFMGFVTANNKKITVSKEAIEKVKGILKEPECENIDTSVLQDITSNPESSTKDDNVSSDFMGFVTASNKQISVSKEAIEKIKGIFNEPVFMNEFNETNVRCIPYKENVKTDFIESVPASNNNVSVSMKALKQVVEIFKETECGNDTWSKNDNSSFFSNIDIVAKSITKKATSNIEDIEAKNKTTALSKKSFEKIEYEYREPFSNVNDYRNTIQSHLVSPLTNMYDSIDSDVVPNANLTSDKNYLNYQNSCSQFKEKQIASSNAPDPIEPPGSPILQIKSYKKKRKSFKVPYKDGKIHEGASEHKKRKIECKIGSIISPNTIPNDEFSNFSLGNQFTIKQNKNNVHLLRDLFKNNKSNLEIGKDLPYLSPSTSLLFKFSEARSDILDMNEIDVEKLVTLFNNHPNIDKSLLPNGWVLNHLKWIIWKLASYERMFGKSFSDWPVLKVSNVMKQLKYRYDKELYHAQRPIIRKILEKDEIPGRKMVLCVSNIIKINTELQIATNNESNLSKSGSLNYEIELTDGWYSIMTTLDIVLCQAILNGKIAIGTKLIIYGAELLNCEQAITPLENAGFVRLKIHANSCRRCVPWMKLGLCKNQSLMTLKLEDCKSNGGLIPNLNVIPLTIYPMLYMTRDTDGSIVMRSERLQNSYDAKLDSEIQSKIEKLYAQIEEEYSTNKRRNSKIICLNSLSKKLEENPEELADILDSVADPIDFLNSMTKSQRHAVEQISMEKQEKIRNEIDSRVKKLIEMQGLVKEKSVKVMKIRILTPGKNNDFVSAILTIWRPDDRIIEELKEDINYNVTNLSQTGFKNGDLQISAGKKSLFHPNGKISNLNSFQKSCTPFESIYKEHFAPPFNEVDIVGLIIKIEVFDSSKSKNNFQTVYVADDHKNIVAVVFWGGVKKSGFEAILNEGKCFAILNLQNRSLFHSRPIKHLHITEKSNIISYSKTPYIQNAMEKLKSNISTHKNDYLDVCLQKLDIDLRKVITFKRKLNSSENVSSPKLNIKNSINNYTTEELSELNLSGIDFDSTFIESTMNDSKKYKFENSSHCVSIKKINISSILAENYIDTPGSSSKVEIKMNKLKRYGDSPPLPPLVLNNSISANQSYKNPFINSSFDKEVLMDQKEKKEEITEDNVTSPPISFD